MSNAPTQFSFVVAMTTTSSFLMNLKVPSVSNGISFGYHINGASGSLSFEKHHTINYGYIAQTYQDIVLRGNAGFISDSFTLYGIVIYQ